MPGFAVSDFSHNDSNRVTSIRPFVVGIVLEPCWPMGTLSAKLRDQF